MRARALCAAFIAVCLFTTSCFTFLHIRERPIDERVRVFLGGGGNSLVYLHGPDALIADVKFSEFGKRLRHTVEKDLERKVRRILLTHSHLDHAGSVDLYPFVGAVMVHPNTRKRLELELTEKGDPLWAPFVEVDEEIRLWLGGEEVLVLYLGVGHTDGDLVLWLPHRKLVFAGDLVSNGYEPSADRRAGGRLLPWRYTLKRLRQLEFDTVVPGHGELMTRAEFDRFDAYLDELESAVREAIGNGRSEDEAAKSITLPSFSDLRPTPVGPDREGNVRAMYREIKETLPGP